MLSAHKQRIITAILLCGILLAAIFLGGWVLKILLLLTSLLALHEFYLMVWSNEGNLSLKKLIGFFLGSLFIIVHGILNTDALMAIAFLFIAIVFLFSFGIRQKDCNFFDFCPTLLGVLYISLSLSLVLDLTIGEQIIIIVSSMATDTGGYYAGSFWGKHKMLPYVSPKKSWEGCFGGMALSIVGCAFLGTLYSDIGTVSPYFSSLTSGSMPQWTFLEWAFVGIFLNIFAQLGDFFESAIKRTFGIKDSGMILPGHGGVLDRIDSLLFVIPAYLLLRTLSILGQ